MAFVVRNEAGRYYAGFQRDQPVWFASCGECSRFDEKTADIIVRQLTALGFTGIEKGIYIPASRKK